MSILVISENELRAALSLPALSPSAPYEMRQKAIEKAGSRGWAAHWWEVYPEGHMAAVAFRVWRALGVGFWEVEGHELPPYNEV